MNDLHDNEIAFIRSLGRWSDIGKLYSRRELLTGYLASTERRTHWHPIDRAAAIKMANFELRRLEAV